MVRIHYIFVQFSASSSSALLFLDLLTDMGLEFFINYAQYKNANIANFVLDMPLKINFCNNAYDPEIWSSYIPWFLILHFSDIIFCK